ncbi:membrane protein [Pseudoclavibacter endophyticus]|uniref:DUF4383 domain-containing protein n=1 Tax=Pseudoclavibacter endophyticus TaxID=1778590 RepID=A0A6H9WNJ2_9MICO|nr:DUF4383 domain-containing protein [Pseudoclavibacter endophyticus]KAB1648338.1 DUF4383 domain-containing protein [Pseudoclavibacter endophyticus]GGA71784.1 membrane protein [Pseudoclavibacter endophyticus]
MKHKLSPALQVRTRGSVCYVALVTGIVFGILGVAGFIPVLTADLRGSGGQSEAVLSETLRISVINSVVYLVYGLAGVMAAISSFVATLFLLGGGVVLWLYALAVPHQSIASVVPLDRGDELLQLVLGTTMVCVAFVLQLVGRGEGGRRRGVSS